MATDYGDDISTFGDDGSIDIDFERVIEGPRVVLENVARRWTMSRNALPWAPPEGENVLRAVNADKSPAELYRLGARLEAEALQERGVLGVAVNAELRPDGGLRVAGRIDLAEGSFPLVVDTGRAAVVLLPRGPMGGAHD
jgi:hypothetical protein